MRGKRKKGNSILLVLSITFVLTAIAVLAITSVLHTTKMNANSKLEEDLLYAAEGGIELGVGKIVKENAISNWIPPVGGETIIKDESEFNSNGIKLDIKIDYIVSDKKFNVESKASTGSGKERIVKAKVSKNINNGNLFNYAICGKAVEVNSGGAIDGQSSPINSSDVDVTISTPGAVAPGASDRLGFTIPQYNFESKPSIKINTGSDAGTDLKSQLTSRIGMGVRQLKLTTPISYDVFLVNTQKLVLNTNGTPIDNVIIICNGDIEVKVPGGGQDFAKSSIIGKKVQVSGGNLHFSYAPYTDNTNPNKAHYPLNDENIREINTFINSNSTNWTGSYTPGASNSFLPEEYEY